MRTYAELMREAETKIINDALAEAKGDAQTAAELLTLPPSTFYRRMNALKIANPGSGQLMAWERKERGLPPRRSSGPRKRRAERITQP